MSTSEAFLVVGDWISEHYFTDDGRGETFLKQVKALRKQWDQDAKEGLDTPVTRFTAQRVNLQEALASISANGRQPTDQKDATLATAARLREVLGFYGNPKELTFQRAEEDITVTATRLGENTDVLWLDAAPLNGTAQGLDQTVLLETNQLNGKDRPDQPIGKLLSELYLSEPKPKFIVVAAGSVLFLTDRERWPEGRYLAADVQLVAERNETKRAGEIDRLLAIFSRNSLMPDESGDIWWEKRLEESHQHAVGVSQELRDGIRESIEIIANDVLARRTQQGLSNDEVDGQDLARQSLRFLYRILFLLYAEAFPELGVLPKGAGEYDAGYGIDRLRELAMVEITSPQEMQGTHLYESLALLFQLVNGDHPSQQDSSRQDKEEDVTAEGLVFESLEADLFQPAATELINHAKLGNLAMQRVLQRLLLSRADGTGPRGYISYANLGINQLGAVYEGLMSYTGFIAETDLREVAKNGDASKGSWVVSTDKAQEIDPKHFVTRTDEETGLEEPILHPKGSFVFRLSGRERQQSASYYTPEVMTKFVVSQALAELLDEDTPADDILELSICEPALGSGAFVIEAVRQLAEEYLERKQKELGHQIEPEKYAEELQRVKAQIALHQVYGVDLNSTAVELAEVSLWLDTMQPGLHAPWFGLRLKRGNSLVGARRATYSLDAVRKKKYFTEAPEPAPLSGLAKALEDESTDPRTQNRIHHFLLPAEGWGAAAKAKEVKDLAADEQRKLRDWARSTQNKLDKRQIQRLQGLAQRVEVLWGITLRRLQIAETEARRFIDTWPHQRAQEKTVVTRADIEASLANENGAYRRLKRVMDAWTALWYWPLTEHEVDPPTIEEWISGLEHILGVHGKEQGIENQRSLLHSVNWNELNDFEALELGLALAPPVDNRLYEKFPWLKVVERVAEEQGFFHWELDFAPVFARGGFDLQVGNPPWVRPDWDEKAIFAEFDPWWQIEVGQTQNTRAARRHRALEDVNHIRFMKHSAAELTALRSFLTSSTNYPIVSGLRPDLYRSFMERTWVSASSSGVVGLVHPESHFTEKRANELRAATYRRLRRHFQFNNELKLYEIGHTRVYGVHIYGSPQEQPGFLMAASLYHPDTALRSLRHEGGTEVPGLKDSHGRWDMRPHPERIIKVDINGLKVWAAINDDPGTSPLHARMIYPVNASSMRVLEKMSDAPRLRRLELQHSMGWNETTDRRRGLFEVGSAVNNTWKEVILQGPHFSVANPFAKQPNPTMRNHLDWTELDLEALSEDFIPRTSYQPQPGYRETYDREYGYWKDGVGKDTPVRSFYRLTWRRMASQTGERTLYIALIPPGVTHVNTVYSAGGGWDCQSLLSHLGFFSSIVIDYFIKVSGVSDIRFPQLTNLPTFKRQSPLATPMMKRAARLVALTSAYGAIVREAGLGSWAFHFPERRAYYRRQLLVELDALAALELGLTIEELVTIYLTQFPVLQGFERLDLYDRNGRKLPNDMNKLYRKVGAEGMSLENRTWVHPQSEVEYVFEFPFTGVDRENDMRMAYEKFSRMLEEHGEIIEDEV